MINKADLLLDTNFFLSIILMEQCPGAYFVRDHDGTCNKKREAIALMLSFYLTQTWFCDGSICTRGAFTHTNSFAQSDSMYFAYLLIHLYIFMIIICNQMHLWILFRRPGTLTFSGILWFLLRCYRLVGVFFSFLCFSILFA